ncbi:MAG: DUF5677 domain-containing protein [Bacteroidales bacterium]
MDINYERDFDLLINISLEIGNKLQGQKIPENGQFIYYAEGLGQKIINHILTARNLFNGYQLVIGKNIYEPKIDYSSIAILTRAALETYLSFNYIFVAVQNDKEKEFRFLCWDLAGYVERSDFEPKIEKHFELKESERKVIEKLRNQLSENSIFKKLSTKNQARALNGQWRLDNSWNQLAVKAGFNKEYFRQQYKFLCGYAHSSRLSIIQIQQNKSIDQQREMAIASVGTLMVILAKHMYDYIEIMPQLIDVKQDISKYQIILAWKTIGEQI